MATAASSVAVAVAAAKIVKGGAVSVGVHMLLRIRMGMGISSGQAIINGNRNRKPTTTRYHGIKSFCTDAAANVDATTTTNTPFSESESESPKSKLGRSNHNNNVRDAGNVLDIRVGRIIKAWKHEEADSLYVEEVDVGEAHPRIICSGLVNYIPLQHLQDRKVVVLTNLKPRNMRGVKSNGMLMAASDTSHQTVELLDPPQASIPGDRIWFASQSQIHTNANIDVELDLEQQNLPPPASPNQIQKKRIWELVQPHLKTNDSCVAMLGEYVMRTSAGVVMCTSLKNAIIS